MVPTCRDVSGFSRVLNPMNIVTMEKRDRSGRGRGDRHVELGVIVIASCCAVVPAVIAVTWLLGMRRKDTGGARPVDEAVKDVAQRESQ